MDKKHAAIAVTVLLLVLLLALSKVVRLPFLSVHPHQAIPSHTALFFEINKKGLEKLLASPQPLAEMFLPKNLRGDFGLLKNALVSLGQPLSDEPSFYISANPSQRFGTDLLFILPDSRSLNLKAISQQSNMQSRVDKFGNQPLCTVKQDGQKFTITKFRNLFIFARRRYLVENAISQLKQPSTSFCREKEFRVMQRRASSDEKHFPLYLNLKNLSAQFAPLLNASKYGQLKKLGQIGSWLHLSLPIADKPENWAGSFAPSPDNSLILATQHDSGSFSNEIWQAVPDKPFRFFCTENQRLTKCFFYRFFKKPFEQRSLVGSRRAIGRQPCGAIFFSKNTRGRSSGKGHTSIGWPCTY